MSKKSSTFEKIAIGAVGIIGGLLLGKAIKDNSKSESKVEVSKK